MAWVENHVCGTGTSKSSDIITQDLIKNILKCVTGVTFNYSWLVCDSLNWYNVTLLPNTVKNVLPKNIVQGYYTHIIIFVLLFRQFYNCIFKVDCLRSFNIFVSSDSEDPTLSTDKELCLFRALPIVDNGMWLGCESEKVGRYEKLYIYAW